MRFVAFSLVPRVAGVHRVLGCLDVVVEVGRGVGTPRGSGTGGRRPPTRVVLSRRS